jgi:hypothetical protein
MTTAAGVFSVSTPPNMRVQRHPLGRVKLWIT